MEEVISGGSIVQRESSFFNFLGAHEGVLGMVAEMVEVHRCWMLFMSRGEAFLTSLYGYSACAHTKDRLGEF